jgi:hypothetical protein
VVADVVHLGDEPNGAEGSGVRLRFWIDFEREIWLVEGSLLVFERKVSLLDRERVLHQTAENGVCSRGKSPGEQSNNVLAHIGAYLSQPL